MDTKKLAQEFIFHYGESEEQIYTFFAPGRVNLIGEHTDYNNGLVLPFSVQYGTYLLVRIQEEPKVFFKSKNFPGTAQICLKNEIKPVGDSWINYPLGVIYEMKNRGCNPGGLQLYFAGDIPNQAGLSSSASIEIVTAFSINELFQCKLPLTDLIKICQKAENEFVGMNCGIMDQFAVGKGEENKALFLNCRTLEYKLVPFELQDHVIIICNTNKKRGLADSKYNERRLECEHAVEQLKNQIPCRDLSDINVDQFIQLDHGKMNPILLKRARHVISENDRVIQSTEFLSQGDMVKFGELMDASHRSLKNDYEVSCYELDIMVEAAGEVEGVLGSRMTGAGFGGCSISLVPQNQIETFINHVGKKYREKVGLKADFYVARPSSGVKEVL